MSNLLAEDNITLLQSGIHLCEILTDEIYSKKQFPFSSSGVGSHLRHSIDHYRCFLNGLESGCVNFNARSRERSIESSRTEAKCAIEQLIRELGNAGHFDDDHSLTIKMDSGENDLETKSTFGRELQFLLSHTIHHYALIRILCASMGVELNVSFGVAPSTLKHQASNRR